MYVDIHNSSIPVVAATQWAVNQGIDPISDKKLFDTFIEGFISGFCRYPTVNPAAPRKVTRLDPSEIELIRTDYENCGMSANEIARKYHRTLASIKGIFARHRMRRKACWKINADKVRQRLKEGASVKEIANELGWSVESARHFIRKIKTENEQI